MQDPGIRSAGPEDEARVVATVTLAFAADPFARWLFPDPASFLAVAPHFTRAFGGNGIAHGSVYLTAGGEAAAMWLPPGVGPDAERLGALMAEHVPPDVFPVAAAVMEAMEQYHPEEPHWYLPTIAVDPAAQNRGLGSALMRHALARCDADGAPAYLESTNPRNVPLYERHGFEILRVVQIASSPEVVPMLRRPR